MTNYITITELANDLGIVEFEVRLVNVSGGDFAVGNTLTGGTSGATMVISRKVSNTRFYVNQVSAQPTLGETLSVGGVSGKLVNHDYNAVNEFIKRVQSIIEQRIHKKLLQTNTQVTEYRTTKRRRSAFNLRNYPVVSVDSVTLDDINFTGDYQLIAKSGVVDFKDNDSILRKARYNGNLNIVYTWGYWTDVNTIVSNLDPSIIAILVKGVQYLYGKWIEFLHGPNAANVSIGSFSISFKDSDIISPEMMKLLQYETRILIWPYKEF